MWGSKSEKPDKTAIALEKLSDTFNNILENEKMSRDRVDISLAEYERLKNENKRLNVENASLSDIIKRIGIPDIAYKLVKPESIKVVYSDSTALGRFTRKYRVEFDVDTEVAIRNF